MWGYTYLSTFIGKLVLKLQLLSCQLRPFLTVQGGAKEPCGSSGTGSTPRGPALLNMTVGVATRQAVCFTEVQFSGKCTSVPVEVYQKYNGSGVCIAPTCMPIVLVYPLLSGGFVRLCIFFGWGGGGCLALNDTALYIIPGLMRS